MHFQFEMTRLVSLLLMSSFLLQSLSKVIILVDYELNKEYITEIFCHNKNKPQLECNGKCHLMKQMKEDDKKEKAPLNNVKEKFEVQLFCSIQEMLSLNSFVISQFNFHSFQLQKTISPSFSIFHPPTC